MHRMWKTIVCLTAVLALCLSSVQAREPARFSQSAQVVVQALDQMGFTEKDNEYTPFGAWYGYPTGHWCDMFVSWCASEAGISSRVFPHSASCTKHCQTFKAMGRYYRGAYWGGDYVPQQGDLALFCSQEGRIHHVGLVLYTENDTLFTVEGNALTVRWDYPAEVVSEARVPEEEPNDYVTVNRYPLTDYRIHGYAVPAYSSREPMELEGFVDLGRYDYAREQINAVAASGLMPGTSSHTFSPRAGMARGEFLQTVLNIYGLIGWNVNAIPFDDVPPEHPYYIAVMTARAAGLLPETWENRFYPDQWISGEDAQAILSALLTRLGMEDRTFTFTPGDLSQILTPYTTRGDIVLALYQLQNACPVYGFCGTGIMGLGQVIESSQALQFSPES